MNATSTKRAEANRRNARKSTGPNTPEGKDRSKFNAVKHGLDAKTIVLPGEDAGAFQTRLDAFASDLRPRNDVEQVLVERSATLSWQLQRADRADAARLASIISTAPAEEALRQADEAAALGQRLFHDPRGPLPLYPHTLYGLNGQPRVSDSGLADDPDDPARLLLRLESTAAGCRWLLGRWVELGNLLDRGLSWQSPDKLKAIRLLGRQPLDAADSDVVALIFQACHVLDPQFRHASGDGPGQEPSLADAARVLDAMGQGAFSTTRDERETIAHDPEADEDLAAPDGPGESNGHEEFGESDGPDDLEDMEECVARVNWQRCGAAFAELQGELSEDEARAYRRRLEGRRVDELRPRDPAEARAKLQAIVDQAAARLEARREVHEQWESAASTDRADRLAFDTSREAERLRRFQLAGNRALLRTLDTLDKLRRDGDDPLTDPAATDGLPSSRQDTSSGEPSHPDPVSGPARTADATCPDAAGTEPGALEPTLNPARSHEDGPAAEPSILPVIAPSRAAPIDRPISRNEPTTAPGRDTPTHSEPADDRQDARNEPMAPADDREDPRDRWSAMLDHRPGVRNEPNDEVTTNLAALPPGRGKCTQGEPTTMKTGPIAWIVLASLRAAIVIESSKRTHHNRN